MTAHKDFMNSVNELLGMVKPDTRVYTRPPRQLVLFEFLTDNIVHPSNRIKHVYPGDEMPVFDFHYAVIHGHGPEITTCPTPFMCHEKNYRPKETDHPSFIRQFYFKWPNYRAKETNVQSDVLLDIKI